MELTDQMRGKGKRQPGFTLIELLTTIAIMGILATLLLTAIASGKKASHRARCTSNLHQISLALNMYMDDFEKRSPNLGLLSAIRYLGNRQALLCPSDKTSGWGNLVNPNPSAMNASEGAISQGLVISRSPDSAGSSIPYSYLNPLGWENWAWDRLSKLGGRAGLAVCQLHGMGRPNLESPSYRDYEGIILRAQRDGAVVKKELYWNNETETDSPPKSAAAVNAADAGAVNPVSSFLYPWKLYSDDPLP